MHGDAVDLLADELGVDIERALERKAVLLEAEVFHQRTTDVAHADEDGGIAAVHAENLCDLAAERDDIITVALLAELAEAAEVLADLGRRKPHLAA